MDCPACGEGLQCDLCGADIPEPLPDAVETVAALDVVLSLARSCSFAHPDRDRSIRAVEGLRAKLREAIR